MNGVGKTISRGRLPEARDCDLEVGSVDFGRWIVI